TEADFFELTSWMSKVFASEHVQIARVYSCPYHPDDGIGVYKFDSPDRKPKPGMLLRARDDFGLDLESSMLIGDKLTDVDAALAAGVGTRILLGLRGSKGERDEERYQQFETLDEIRRVFFGVRDTR